MRNRCILLMLVAIAAISACPACYGKGYALLVEQAPMEGGIVTPSVGVHSFTPGETITITAAPRPGYRFVRWMGDVSVADTSTTTLTLDSPKILVALFEKIEQALPLPPTEELGETDENAIGGGGGSSGRMIAQSIPVGGGGGVSPSGSPLPHRRSSITNNIPDEELPTGEVPVPTPEPGTIAIMGLGAVIALVGRKV